MIIVLAAPASAFAWTAAFDQHLASQASRLAPADLKTILDLYDREFQRGLEAAANEEAGSRGVHHYSTGSGQLQVRLSMEIDESVRMMKEREPVRLFVYRLGVISHLVGDLNNPFHAFDADARMRCCKGDYERYVERRLSKIRPVFYGLEPRLAVDTYLRKSTERSIQYYPLLTEEYFRNGRRRTSSEFDDRSTAFGVASLTTSHAVTDLVNIYFHIWREVGGKTSEKPSLRNSQRTLGGGFGRE